MPEDLIVANTVPTATAGGKIQTEAPESVRKAGWIRWAWDQPWGKGALILAAIFIAGNEITQKNRLEIETIGVPKKLTEDGFSTDVVTRRLRDAIKEVQNRAKTTLEKNRIDVHEDISDVTIPGTGLSAENVAAWFRYLLPESWQHNKISGEFISSGAELSVRVRLNGEVVFSDVSAAPDAVEGLIDRAALKLVERTQPYIAAAALFQRDDFSSAVQLADQIIDSLPPEDEGVMQAYMLKRRIAERQKDVEKAAAFYRKYPNSAAARLELGTLSYNQHKLEEAINEYQLAIQLNPKFAFPHHNLGNVFYDQGKREEAISEYRRAIQLNPNLAGPHVGLGDVLRDQHKSEQAISEYRRASQLDPKAALPHISLGIALSEQGKGEEAISEYRLAIKRNPEFAFAHYGLGDALRDQGKSEEAISEYRLSIKLDPQNAVSHKNLGKILAKQVGPETPQDQAVRLLIEACEQIQLGARLAPDDPEYSIAAHRIDAKFAGRSHCLPE